MDIIQIPVLTDNYIYLIHDPASAETAAVDPALAEPVLAELARRGWTLTYILNTHHHNDHVGGNIELKRATACQIIASAADRHRIPGIDRAVDGGDEIRVGRYKAQVISTPGHTGGHVVYHFAEDHALFCGDTLFVMGCGRLFDGTIGQLWESLQMLQTLPDATRIFCAHEYTQNNGRFALAVDPDNLALQAKMAVVADLRAKQCPTVPSTMLEERATNPFLRADDARVQKNMGLFGKSPFEVFTALRAMKDRF